ncbi:effector-associated constant component EACC1 [Pseudonocardia acaciae]|uniref:effector-associated constant component EACC1 n=1 Tax=Pseudonocardia acaciae TaxID=551276 RepID=UPI000687F923|nr:hypothetical protein [Pseudonocardia acaciae]
MAVVLVVVGEAVSADELRGLRAWLVGEDELRGRVRLRERPPPQGVLGPVVDAALVEAVTPPVAGALAAALVAWLRSRVNRFRLEVHTDRGGRMVLDVRQIKELDPRAVEELIDGLAATITGQGDQRAGEPAGGDPPNPGERPSLPADPGAGG